MITLKQYFGKFLDHEDVTDEIRSNATSLLAACEKLESLAIADGVVFLINPITKSGISGTQYGGFRPQSCVIGATKSSHKIGRAIDLYDPEGKIDQWCFAHSEREGYLSQCGIYIEHPSKTLGWSHWTTRRPGSGNRVFFP